MIPQAREASLYEPQGAAGHCAQHHHMHKSGGLSQGNPANISHSLRVREPKRKSDVWVGARREIESLGRTAFRGGGPRGRGQERERDGGVLERLCCAQTNGAGPPKKRLQAEKLRAGAGLASLSACTETQVGGKERRQTNRFHPPSPPSLPHPSLLPRLLAWLSVQPNPRVGECERAELPGGGEDGSQRGKPAPGCGHGFSGHYSQPANEQMFTPTSCPLAYPRESESHVWIKVLFSAHPPVAAQLYSCQTAKNA